LFKRGNRGSMDFDAPINIQNRVVHLSKKILLIQVGYLAVGHRGHVWIVSKLCLINLLAMTKKSHIAAILIA
jgi:hypothetical protein